MNRRGFLKKTGLAGAALAASRFLPAWAQAATVPTVEEVQDIEHLDEGLKEVLGIDFAKLEPSDKVTINAPEIAESGANVPVEIVSELAPSEVKGIHCFVDKNPFPHIFSMSLGPKAAQTYFATRIRIGETAPVRIVVETTDGRYLLASHVTRVTVGGCG
ncbi:MAG TPA: thiosulfate oxidation carrier protein SoxY [Oceanithermus profundus]|uniref:Thiosulfate oxidation carrier protein SoxY n=1 Tax=Oceanithermus profundus TaxID=187137 RepID=A0A7C4ZR08_9DEIN|nr:thiosulfate oxidation carrier protein SoxY [Oceanithermus profundus]